MNDWGDDLSWTELLREGIPELFEDDHDDGGGLITEPVGVEQFSWCILVLTALGTVLVAWPLARTLKFVSGRLRNGAQGRSADLS